MKRLLRKPGIAQKLAENRRRRALLMLMEGGKIKAGSGGSALQNFRVLERSAGRPVYELSNNPGLPWARKVRKLARARKVLAGGFRKARKAYGKGHSTYALTGIRK